MGRRLGDPDDPLLVSVRSGAKFSMPGMMDTVLNLGLNDRSVEGSPSRPMTRRFAFDSYRRFVQMYGASSSGSRRGAGRATRRPEGARTGASDAELPARRCKARGRAEGRCRASDGHPIPPGTIDQLRGAIEAVFASGTGPGPSAYPSGSTSRTI